MIKRFDLSGKKGMWQNGMAESNALCRFFILRAISGYRPVSNFLYLLTYFVASFVRNGDVETNNQMHNNPVHIQSRKERFGEIGEDR